MAEAARRIVELETDYERDFHAWALAQARLLRAGVFAQIDIENVAEELETLGRSERAELRSHMTRIAHHLFKLEISPASDPVRGWRLSVAGGRMEAQRVLQQNPSLRPLIDRLAREASADAAKFARIAIDAQRELTPAAEIVLSTRRHSAAQLLDDWWPDTV